MPTVDQVTYMLLTYRNNNNLSQVEVAKEFGVSTNSIVDVEKMRDVSPRNLVRIYNKLLEKGIN